VISEKIQRCSGKFGIVSEKELMNGMATETQPAKYDERLESRELLEI